LNKKSCRIHNNHSNESGNDNNDSKEFVVCNWAKNIYTFTKSTEIDQQKYHCVQLLHFSFCNLARVKDRDYILDPFAGICTTLLAKTVMAKKIKSASVEIADYSVVDCNNTKKDHEFRG
jgi:hypothetical protein